MLIYFYAAINPEYGFGRVVDRSEGRSIDAMRVMWMMHEIFFYHVSIGDIHVGITMISR